MDLCHHMGEGDVTLVSCDGGDVFGRWGQAEDPSAVDASFRLHVVLERAVDPGRKARHILRLEHQLGRKTRRQQVEVQQKFESIYFITDDPQQKCSQLTLKL